MRNYVFVVGYYDENGKYRVKVKTVSDYSEQSAVNQLRLKGLTIIS